MFGKSASPYNAPFDEKEIEIANIREKLLEARKMLCLLGDKIEELILENFELVREMKRLFERGKA